MSLVENVRDAFARVAAEVSSVAQTNQALAQAILDLDQSIIQLQGNPIIIISDTAPPNPTENTVWLDTSGG